MRTRALLLGFSIFLFGCNLLLPLPGEARQTPTPAAPVAEGFPDRSALPNDSGIEGVQIYPDKTEYHDHVDSVPQPDGGIPPSFGQHFSAWQNCGVYDRPVELGLALHSLEHGAVWLTYRPDLDSKNVEQLQELVRGHDYVLMSPYLNQPADVVLSAWTVQLVIESLPDDRIQEFIDYYEQGLQNPEPGAPCSGAIGQPLP